MPQPRLQLALAALFEQHKDPALLKACLEHPDYQSFQDRFGLKLPSAELLKVFTHTSFSHEFNLPHQEQLEFLGDAVLQLILTDELCRLYPEEKEGRLSKLRSSIVNEKTLATLARHLGLSEFLLVGRGEFNKRLCEQDVVLADTFEALLAVIYQHHGLEFTRGLLLLWLQRFVPAAMSMDSLLEFDAKSKLQELSLAKYRKLPRYSSLSRGDKFEVQLWINDELLASGLFPSKKSGEKELAADVLKRNLIY